jgi:hypothetical protein
MFRRLNLLERIVEGGDILSGLSAMALHNPDRVRATGPNERHDRDQGRLLECAKPV